MEYISQFTVDEFGTEWELLHNCFDESAMHVFDFVIHFLCGLLYFLFFEISKNGFQQEVLVVFVRTRICFLFLFVTNCVLLLLQHVSQLVEISFDFGDLLLAEFAVTYEFLGEAEVVAVDVEVAATVAEDFAAEATVVATTKEGEVEAAALAFGDVLVSRPLFARTELGLELLPEFLLHLVINSM